MNTIFNIIIIEKYHMLVPLNYNLKTVNTNECSNMDRTCLVVMSNPVRRSVRYLVAYNQIFNFLIFIACTVFYRRIYESGIRIAGSGFVLLLIRGFRFVDRFSVVRCMASLSLIMVFFLSPAPN